VLHKEPRTSGCTKLAASCGLDNLRRRVLLAVSQLGNSKLHEAAVGGNHEETARLLALGADVNIRGEVRPYEF
jgi:hypothetical protein